MDTVKLGYARVSTRAATPTEGEHTSKRSKEQTLDQQIEILRSYGVPEENIYTDRISGRKNLHEGPGWAALRERIRWTAEREDIELVVVRVDRLSRDYQDIQQEINTLLEWGVGLTAVHEGLRNYRKEDDQANDDAWFKRNLDHLLSERERRLISKRTKEKLEYLRDVKGIKLGRPTKLTPEVLDQIDFFRNEKKKSLQGVADAVGLSKATVRRGILKLEEDRA